MPAAGPRVRAHRVRAVVGAIAAAVAIGSVVAPRPAPASALRTYVVERGDNLTHIARRFDVSLGELIAANRVRRSQPLAVGQKLRIPTANLGSLPSRLRTNPARLALRPQFVQWANRNAVPVDLLEATLWLESGWNQSRISSTGAVGIGQLMPATAAFIESELIGADLDPHRVEDNIRMSARYLRFLLRFTNGDSTRALQAYYQGIGSIRVNGLYPDTLSYAASVQALRARFRADPTGR